MITRTRIHQAMVGEKEGWAFSVYFGKEYAGLKSALYKTKEEATDQLERYLKTGEYDLYGSAE